jgi:hypothetical protein
VAATAEEEPTVEPWVVLTLALVWVTLVVWVVATLTTIRREVAQVKAAGAARGEAIRVIQGEVEVIQAAVAVMEAVAVTAVATGAGVVMEVAAANPQTNPDMDTVDPITTTDTVTTMVTTTPITPARAKVITDATATTTAKAKRRGVKDAIDD